MRRERRLAAPTDAKHNRKGTRGRRDGFPAIFMSTGRATQLLVQIAAMEPVTIREINGGTEAPGNRYIEVRRLDAQGLIRRYKGRIYQGGCRLAINRDHPAIIPFRCLLTSNTCRQPKP